MAPQARATAKRHWAVSFRAVLALFAVLFAPNTSVFAQSAPPFEGAWAAPHQRDHPLVGSVFRGDGTPVLWTDVEKAIRTADLVVVGETHDNVDHHKIQALVADVLDKRAKLHAVVWEMVPLGMQSALDQFGKGTIDKADLEAALEWEKRGWGNFGTRQIVFELAVQSGALMLAGNADLDVVRVIGRQGRTALPAKLAKRSAFDVKMDDQQQTELLKDMATSHCNMLPERLLPNLAVVQRLRDGLMAQQAIDALMEGTNNSTALVITGNGHARKDRGVPFFAKAMNKGAFQTVIGLIDVSKEGKAFSDYPLLDGSGKPLYDFVLFTPAASVGDPCEEMRKMMKRKKN